MQDFLDDVKEVRKTGYRYGGHRFSRDVLDRVIKPWLVRESRCRLIIISEEDMGEGSHKMSPFYAMWVL